MGDGTWAGNLEGVRYVVRRVMTTSYSSSRHSSPRWAHSSRGAPLLRAIPAYELRDRDDRDPLAECAESAAIAIEWLEQGLTTLSIEEHAAVVHTITGLLGEVRDVHAAAARVRRHEDAIARIFQVGSPLHAHLADLYAWSEGICGALDEIAVAVRRGEPVRTIFLHRSINASYTRLEGELRAALAELSAGTNGADASAARALDADLEELLWATTWLHLSLTKGFGE